MQPSNKLNILYQMSKKNQILISVGLVILLGGAFIGFFQIKKPLEIKNSTNSQNNNSISPPEHTAHKPQQIFIALGDSLTEGYQLSSKHAYPYLLETRLNKDFPKYETKVINAGISGSTTSSGVHRLKKHLRLQPRAVLISLGSNDGLRGVPIDSIKKNLQAMIDLAFANKISVLLAGLKLPANYGTEYRKAFEKIFKELSEKNNIVLIPFLLEEVAGKAELNLPDLIHPNEEGHKVMTQTLYPYFKQFYKPSR